jgi:ribosomal protein S18 acetylase RimI-like enzyme
MRAPAIWPPGLPVTQVRIARPTDKLDEVVRFYAADLGLPELERFSGHAGYEGVMLGLPGTDHHLEFTAHVDGTPGPAPTRENLLVLYCDEPAALAATVARLRARHRSVPLDNPYWAGVGAVAFADPDGWRVVLAPAAAQLSAQDSRRGTGPEPDDVRIEPYTGARTDLRWLFELADDSPTELDSYLHAGRVLVALSGPDVIGHIQLVDTDRPGRVELKNMAVREAARGRGVGARLVRAALAVAAAGSASEMVVATAAADTGNLRFYQRHGFRVRGVERDASTPVNGYPPGLDGDGIPLRDRVWLDRAVD